MTRDQARADMERAVRDAYPERADEVLNGIGVRYTRVHAHRKDCIASGHVTDGSWDTAWYFSGRGYGTKTNPAPTWPRSRMHPHATVWLLFYCNSIETHPCPAILAIRENDLLLEVPKK